MMNSKKNLSIATATITIRVVQVDGHKMTKATFRQIQNIRLEKWPGNEKILGWVNDDGPNIIFVEDGKLLRASITNWHQKLADGTQIPMSESLEQLFIAT